MNPGEQIGAFRLVRLLGSGTRSRVFLGHDGERAAAVKVFRPGATPESIDDEIAALSSASHAHIVQLREVGSSPSGLPFLVLERLEALSLGALLASRSALGAGEAVTVLAPITAAVGALHSSGVAHGTVGPERVLFRATGAPVLSGLGRATLFVPPSTPAMLSSSRSVLEDRLAVGRLVQTVIARLDGNGAQLAAWLTELERDGYPDGFIELLLDRVFALGRPAPVRFALPATDDVLTPPAISAVENHESTASRTVGQRVAHAVQSRLSNTRRVHELADRVRTVRRPVVLAAVLAVGFFVAALVLLPPEQAGEAAPQAVESTPEPRASTSPVTRDDPLAAFSALMAQRNRCIRDLSVLCLEAVDQSGSAALDDDVALIRSIEAGQTTGILPEIDETSIVLTERHGDAALVGYTSADNSEPASVLLVKGEAGWRIRDYLSR